MMKKAVSKKTFIDDCFGVLLTFDYTKCIDNNKNQSIEGNINR